MRRSTEAPAALRAVLAPALAPEGTLEQIKVRNETLNAKLKEVELAKKTKGLLPDQFCFGLVDCFIKYVAGKFEDLRLRGAVNREWIAECERHWGELLHADQEFPAFLELESAIRDCGKLG